jgi:hypothetical protein
VLISAKAAFKRPDARPLQSEANMQSLLAHIRLQPKHILAILVELSSRITDMRETESQDLLFQRTLSEQRIQEG